MFCLRLIAVVLGLVALGAAPSSAQSLSGRVTDAETGDPLPGATVAVPLCPVAPRPTPTAATR